MGFTKLDPGIVDSSLWSEPMAVRVLWITLLAKTDCTGHVRAARDALHRAANMPSKEFDSAMQVLESPDPNSRSSEYEGRRIKKVEGGWLILNYLKYRDYCYSSNPETLRKRRQRASKLGIVPDMSRTRQNVPGHSVSVSSSVSDKGGVGENNNFKEVERRLLPLFQRELDGMFYEEQEQIFFLSQRPRILSELAEIEAFRTKPESYFPQSLYSLVNNWQQTLDRARSYKPKSAVDEQKQLERELRKYGV